MIASMTHTLLVLGCQRSGTTMTGQILGAHENAILIDEFEGLYPWFHAVADQAEGAAQHTDKVLRKSAEKYKNLGSKYTEENGQIKPASHISHTVLKAPNLTFEEPKITNLKGQLRIVFPQRDPRAVVSSMLRLSHIDFVGNQIRRLQSAHHVIDAFEDDCAVLFDDTQPIWVRAAKIWKIKTGLSAHFAAKGHPVLPFKYEDLVATPDSVIPQILEFCDLPVSETALHPEALYTGEGPGGTDRTRRIDTQALERWRKDMTPDQTRDVLHATAPLAEELGFV